VRQNLRRIKKLLLSSASKLQSPISVVQYNGKIATNLLHAQRFTNIYAEHLYELRRSPDSSGRIALPVAGDDPAAKAVVLRLIDELGFDAVDARGLDESWRQQPGTPVYAADFDAAGVRRALALATPERKPEWRATPMSPGAYSVPQ